MSSTYAVAEFNDKNLPATEKAWLKELDTAPSVFPSDVAKAIEFAKNHTVYNVNTVDSCAYGIFLDNHHAADSILDVVVSKQGKKLVKMLDCMVRPSIMEKAYNNDLPTIQKLVEIYAAAITGTIGLANHHKASEMKVYGRTDRLLVVLTSVADSISRANVGAKIKVAIEGRWLTVKQIQTKGVKK